MQCDLVIDNREENKSNWLIELLESLNILLWCFTWYCLLLLVIFLFSNVTGKFSNVKNTR